LEILGTISFSANLPIISMNICWSSVGANIYYLPGVHP
jgi:hypothetical protein